MSEFVQSLEEVARAAGAIASVLEAHDRVPEACEDSVSRALVVLEDVQRGFERTATRNEGGSPGWIVRSNLELITRLAQRLKRIARERPGDVRDWMRFKTVQAASALDDCLRILLRARPAGVNPGHRRNPWLKDGWIDASVEIVCPSGSRELAWELDVFDPTSEEVLTEDDIEDRLIGVVRRKIESGFIANGEEVVIRIGRRVERYRVAPTRAGLGLVPVGGLGPAPGLPRKTFRMDRGKPKRTGNPRNNPGALSEALRRAHGRLEAANRYLESMALLEAEILEESRPFFGSAAACGEIQGLMPRGTYAGYVASRAAAESCGPARPVVPGEGALPLGFAEGLLDKTRRYEQLQALADRAIDGAWRDIRPQLDREAACREALAELRSGGESAAVLAIRVRNHLLEILDRTTGASANPRRRNPIPDAALEEVIRLAETSTDMFADASRIGMELREGILPYLTTRRACDEFREFVPRGSFLSFTVLCHRDDLPPDEPGAPGLSRGILEAVDARLERLRRAFSAGKAFDAAAIEAIKPYADATTIDDIRRVVRSTPSKSSIHRLAASRLDEAGASRASANRGGARRNGDRAKSEAMGERRDARRAAAAAEAIDRLLPEAIQAATDAARLHETLNSLEKRLTERYRDVLKTRRACDEYLEDTKAARGTMFAFRARDARDYVLPPDPAGAEGLPPDIRSRLRKDAVELGAAHEEWSELYSHPHRLLAEHIAVADAATCKRGLHAFADARQSSSLGGMRFIERLMDLGLSNEEMWER